MWFKSMRSVILLVLSTSEKVPSASSRCRTLTSLSSGLSDSSWSGSSSVRMPCSTSCMHAIDVASLVKDASQNTVSGDMGCWDETPTVPEQCWTMGSPSAPKAQ